MGPNVTRAVAVILLFIAALAASALAFALGSVVTDAVEAWIRLTR